MQRVGAQAVSGPVALSPAARVLPGTQGTQAWFATRWLAGQITTVQVVSAPVARSPAGLVLPGAQATQVWLETN